jgi:hypothetical protein
MQGLKEKLGIKKPGKEGPKGGAKDKSFGKKQHKHGKHGGEKDKSAEKMQGLKEKLGIKKPGKEGSKGGAKDKSFGKKQHKHGKHGGEKDKSAEKMQGLKEKLGIKKPGKEGSKGGAKYKSFGKNKGDKGKGKEGDRKDNKEDKQDKDRKNQEKLDKAVRELQPKVHALLGRGVSGIRLRGQLAFWRIQYGLSRLDVQNSGKESFRIIAQVNPKAEIIKGVEIDQEELLLYVRKVIEDVLNHQTTKDGATNILKSAQPGQGPYHYTVSQDQNISAVLAAAQQMPKRNQGTAEILNFSTNNQALNTQVRREQGRGGSTKNKLVYKMKNNLFKRGDRQNADYASLAQELDNIGTTPDERTRLAEAIETWTRFRIVPQGFEQHKDLIAQMGILLGVQEADRSKGGLAMAAFLLPLVSKYSWKEVLIDKEAPTGENDAPYPIYPMAPQKSQQDAKNLDNYLERWQKQQPENNNGDKEPAAKKRKITPGKRQKAMMDREFNFIKAWLKELDLKFADQASEQQKIAEIKQTIRKRILAFGGIDE